MAKQIAHGDIGIGQRIGELEIRKVLPDRIVPTHLPLIDENPQGGASKSFRAGADREYGV